MARTGYNGDLSVHEEGKVARKGEGEGDGERELSGPRFKESAD